MAKVCINCGKKIGLMVKEPPLELCGGHVLCDDCAEPIRRRIGKLYNLKTTAEFNEAKAEILQECKKHYSATVTDAVEERINDIYTNSLRTQLEPEVVAEENAQIEKAKREADLAFKKLAENQMLTTGYDFSGYKITKYTGIISGEVVLGTSFLSEFSASLSDLLGSQSWAFADKLDTAKKAAIDKLTYKSAEKGGNAVIGIDFDYITFANNMIGVVANGTSVVIEKIE